MSDVAQGAIGTSAGTAGGFRPVFLGALLVATLATVALYPIAPKFFRPSADSPHVTFVVLGWLSTAHVATTAFFYLDKSFLPHALDNRARYIWIPLGIVVGAAVIYGVVGKENHPYLWFFFTAWLLWHYQKQNVGICSLVATSTKGDRITSDERQALLAVGIAGIIGAMRFKSQFLPGVDAEQMRQAGMLLFIPAAAAAVYHVYRRLCAGLKKNLPSALFILASVAFFMPTFMKAAYFPAITSYAVAHALQYWLLMSYLAISASKRNGVLRSLGGGALLVVSVWGVIYFARDAARWGDWAAYMIGLQFGITMAHFIIDADAWRMSEKFQRGYLRERFTALLS